MAFGTGTHPTTQLCLQLLEQHLKPGQPIIDVGCGSGILSIAAVKLGASHVLAVDVDRQAVVSTNENAEINDLPPCALETGVGSVTEILENQFSIQDAPLVLVNILAQIILNLFEKGLGKLVQGNGLLLLSGILDHQEQEVQRAAVRAGFILSDKLQDGDWVSLALHKQ